MTLAASICGYIRPLFAHLQVLSAALTSSSASVSEYRRHRKHRFPLDAYKTATATGGSVSAYCGIVRAVPKANPADIQEVAEAGTEDCVTCVDLWLGQKWVRL